MASLRYQFPGKQPTAHALRSAETTLGTAPHNDIVLHDPSLQPCHALIRSDGTSFEFATTERKCEAWVNDRKRSKHALADGDIIRLGMCTLTFSLYEHGEAKPATASHAPHQVELGAYRRLLEFSQALATTEEPQALLEKLVDTLIDLSTASSGFLLTSEDGQLTVSVARNLRRENVAAAIDQMSDTIVARCVQTRAPVLVQNGMTDTDFASARSVIELKLTSALCVPLVERGTLLGVLYLGSHSLQHAFSPQTLELVGVFAAQAALLVGNAFMLRTLRGETARLQSSLDAMKYGELVGTSAPMQELFRRIDKVARTDVSVLITGETGTGKELIAKELHRRSARADKPFVAINCGAIPAELLESELFGHVKGAFTGAIANKPGHFHAAHRGTLFLDEIGEMPLALQVKLLRAIQERTVMRVGAEQPERVDIRILTATHRDLEAMIAAGQFREDLFYRLNVVQLHLPPLRERGDDVILLAKTIIQRVADELAVSPPALSVGAIAALRRYPWPGNIRELENRIRRAIVLAGSNVLDGKDLGLSDDAQTRLLSLAEAKENFARQYVHDVLELNKGNRSKTARDLDVDPRTIFRYLERDEGTGESP